MSQISVETKFVPGKTFTLAPFSNFYQPFVDNKLMSYISCWVDKDGNTYTDQQEVSFSTENVDLSAKWTPIPRRFQATLNNCTATLSCIPNKFPSMSSTISLSETQLSGIIYKDSKLMLSVIPSEGHYFDSAVIIGKDVNSNGQMINWGSTKENYFTKDADDDNRCNTILSGSLTWADVQKILTDGTDEASSYKFFYDLHLSVICPPNGNLTYWKGSLGEEVV